MQPVISFCAGAGLLAVLGLLCLPLWWLGLGLHFFGLKLFELASWLHYIAQLGARLLAEKSE